MRATHWRCGVVHTLLLASVAGTALAQPEAETSTVLPDGARSGSPQDVARKAGTSTRTLTRVPPRVRSSLPHVVVPRVDQSGQPSEPQAAPSDDGESLRILARRHAALAADDLRTAESEVSRLMELKAQAGAANLPLVSSVLIHSAREALKNKDVARASLDADLAALLSPDMVDVHWIRFDISLAQEHGTGLAALSAFLSGVRARVHGFRNQLAAFTDCVGTSLLALLAVALVFSALQWLHFRRAMARDLVSLLPSWTSPALGFVCLLLVTITPLLAARSVLLTLTVWLIGCGLYQHARARWVSVGILVGLALIPWALGRTLPAVLFHGSEIDHLAIVAEEGRVATSEAVLERIMDTGAGDFEAAFLLGQRARTRGDLRAAKAYYTRATELEPGSSASHNNLANVLYLLHQVDEAKAALKRAADAEHRPEPHLNLAWIFLEEGLFDDAKRELDAAREINPELTSSYTNTEAGVSPSARLLDISLEHRDLFRRVFSRDAADGERLFSQLWMWLGGRASPAWTSGIGFFGIVLLVVWGFFRNPLHTPCEKCGAPAERNGGDELCEPCGLIYLPGAAIDVSMRLQQETAIRRYQRLRVAATRVLSLVAGAGQIIHGHALEGFAFLWVFAWITVHWLWMNHLQTHAWSLGVGASTPQTWVSIFLLAAMVTVSWFRTRQA